MIKKLLLIAFILLNVKVSVAYTSNTVPPVLTNFRIEATEPSRIYFDSNEPITASNVAGFVLNDNTITNVTINSNQLLNHYFTVSSSFKWFNHNAIRYIGGSDFENQNAIALSKFDLQYVENKIVPVEGTTNTYFVNAAVSISGDGSTELKAFKTIQEAANVATAGSKIWIKAGNYGSENITFPKGGRSSKPIVFEGYKEDIGDISSMYYNYGDGDLDATKMPLLDGGNRGTGIAINLKTKSYIFLRNIQITNYKRGIKTQSLRGIILENLLITNIGRTSSNKGTAIHFDSASNNASYNKFKNCTIINATISAFMVAGNNNLIENCKAYCNEANNFNDIYATTDYYFIARGSNNIIRNSLAHKDTPNGGGHLGHGFALKASDQPCEYNLIELNTSINIYGAYEARHPETKFNVFKDLISHADVTNRRSSNTGSAAINILQGADSNIFERVYGHHLDVAIRFGDNTEDNTHQMGVNNVIKNCVFDNVKAVVLASNVSRATSRPTGNKAYNNTFNNADYLFRISNTSDPIVFSNNEWKNNIFNNIRVLDDPRMAPSNGWSYEYNNFYDGFTKPSGTGNTSVDPKFVNVTVGDFKLADDSPMIDAGLNIINEVLIDFEENSRLQGTSLDVGAYEYQDNTVSSINANAGPDVEICNGEQTILTATGNGDFLWSTGETTASITANPTTTTSYTVTVTDTDTNESETDDITVTVQVAPSVILGNDLSICSGENKILIASGNGDFLWSTGETTASITVNPTATTTYSVIASNSCSSTATDDIIVTVIPGIDLDAGNDITLCSGESTVLTATGNGDFLWSTGETTASISVNPTTTSTYTVISTLGNCSLSDEVLVKVNNTPSVNLGEDVTLCSGDLATLTAQGEGDILWSTGETTSSIEVSPTETTTYTVTISNSCDSVSDEIIVNITPEVTLDVGDDVTLCLGESITLTAQGGNGDFLWSTGETNASITVSPSATTTYIVTSSRGGCVLSDEVTVAINNPPAVSLEEDEIRICIGDSITLTAIGNGDFLWNTGETTSRITVNPVIATSYTVTVSGTCGESVSDEILITINEPIVADAGEDVVINEGYSVVLTASGGEEYLWSTGETTESIIVNPTEDTIYYVEVSKYGCSDVDDVKVIVEEAVVMINNGLDITICEGEEVALEAKGGVNYLWNTGEITAIIQAKPEVTTTYYVSALKNGIIQKAEITINVDDCSDNSNNRVSDFEVYPNPTEGLINVFLPELREKVRLSLVSLSGSLIYNKEIKADSNGIFTQIDLSTMAKGVYFLRMYNANFNETKKILVI